MPDPGEIEIVSLAVAARLIDALPTDDRSIWATALYAGLRYGELRALRWGAVDLDAGMIRVRESWDPLAGSIAPKTRTSQRTTPMPAVLRDLLLGHLGRGGGVVEDTLVFGGSDGAPLAAALLDDFLDRRTD